MTVLNKRMCLLWLLSHSNFTSQAAEGSNIGQGHSGVYQICPCILLLPTSGAIFQVVYESHIY